MIKLLMKNINHT